MASIRPYKDGYRVFINRKGFRPTATFKTKVAAKRWATKIEAQIDEGTFNPHASLADITLSEALDRYAEEVTDKKGGARQELSKIRTLKREYKIARLPLNKIKPADVIAFRREMEKKGRKPNTIRLYMAILSHLFTVAREDWGMDFLSTPVHGRAKPPTPKGRDRRLEAGEEEILLAGCKRYGGDIYDIFIFAVETAMRETEIATITWENVDLQDRIVHLYKTKNGEDRDVPLSSRAYEILKRRSKVRKLNDNRVFFLKAKSIYQAFKRVCERNGIEDLTFHDLRHEATSRLFEKGLNPMQVAAITGHKDMKMLKRYTHLRAKDLVEMLG